MNSDAGPFISLVIALIAGVVGGPKGKGAAYGALVGSMFLGIWGAWGMRPSTGLGFFALATMFLFGAFQGLIWGGLWGAVGGFFTRRPKAGGNSSAAGQPRS